MIFFPDTARDMLQVVLTDFADRRADDPQFHWDLADVLQVILDQDKFRGGCKPQLVRKGTAR